MNEVKVKVVGTIVRCFAGSAIVQVKDGSVWSSYFLHYTDVKFCEPSEPQVGCVVRFEAIPIPANKPYHLPKAVRAKIFLSHESMQQHEAAAALVAAATPDSSALDAQKGGTAVTPKAGA